MHGEGSCAWLALRSLLVLAPRPCLHTANLQEVHDTIKRHYHLLHGAFVYYASLGSGDP